MANDHVDVALQRQAQAPALAEPRQEEEAVVEATRQHHREHRGGHVRGQRRSSRQGRHDGGGRGHRHDEHQWCQHQQPRFAHEPDENQQCQRQHEQLRARQPFEAAVEDPLVRHQRVAREEHLCAFGRLQFLQELYKPLAVQPGCVDRAVQPLVLEDRHLGGLGREKYYKRGQPVARYAGRLQEELGHVQRAQALGTGVVA
mmetsp:Transcript_49274/g.140992  ORF Transcript_49274/g.140992 Transcript_49274/m.140992 type:complete len:201 (+) Transcript_49274:443-1045(+)